jgi:hypothetical protein
VLRCIADLERASEHPLARAIVDAAQARGIPNGAVERFASITGQGVTGVVGGRSVAFGNERLMKSLGVEVAKADAARFQSDGATVMYCAVDGAFAALVAVMTRSSRHLPKRWLHFAQKVFDGHADGATNAQRMRSRQSSASQKWWRRVTSAQAGTCAN